MKFTIECPQCVDERLQGGAETPPEDERSTTFSGTLDKMTCPKCGFVFAISDVLKAVGAGPEKAEEIEEALKSELAQVARKARRKLAKGR